MIKADAANYHPHPCTMPAAGVHRIVMSYVLCLCCVLWLRSVHGGIAGLSKFTRSTFRNAWIVDSHSHRKLEVDHVCIDMNQLLHHCFRSTQSADHVIAKIFVTLDGITHVASPRKSLVLAFDGPAPFAKMQTQRNRRSSSPEVSLITPGTDFMNSMENIVICYVLQRFQRPHLRGVSVFISDGTCPGEGELKILSWIKNHMPSTELGSMGHDSSPTVGDFITHGVSANEHGVYSHDGAFQIYGGRGNSNRDEISQDKRSSNSAASGADSGAESGSDSASGSSSRSGVLQCRPGSVVVCGSDSDILLQAMCLERLHPDTLVLPIEQGKTMGPTSKNGGAKRKALTYCNITLLAAEVITHTRLNLTQYLSDSRGGSSSNRTSTSTYDALVGSAAEGATSDAPIGSTAEGATSDAPVGSTAEGATSDAHAGSQNSQGRRYSSSRNVTSSRGTKSKPLANNVTSCSGTDSYSNSMSSRQLLSVAAQRLSLRADLVLLFVLQGNDFLPKLRGVSMHRCLAAYGRVMNSLEQPQDRHLVAFPHHQQHHQQHNQQHYHNPDCGSDLHEPPPATWSGKAADSMGKMSKTGSRRNILNHDAYCNIGSSGGVGDAESMGYGNVVRKGTMKLTFNMRALWRLMAELQRADSWGLVEDPAAAAAVAATVGRGNSENFRQSVENDGGAMSSGGSSGQAAAGKVALPLLMPDPVQTLNNHLYLLNCTSTLAKPADADAGAGAGATTQQQQRQRSRALDQEKYAGDKKKRNEQTEIDEPPNCVVYTEWEKQQYQKPQSGKHSKPQFARQWLASGRLNGREYVLPQPEGSIKRARRAVAEYILQLQYPEVHARLQARRREVVLKLRRMHALARPDHEEQFDDNHPSDDDDDGSGYEGGGGDVEDDYGGYSDSNSLCDGVDGSADDSRDCDDIDDYKVRNVTQSGPDASALPHPRSSLTGVGRARGDHRPGSGFLGDADDLLRSGQILSGIPADASVVDEAQYVRFLRNSDIEAYLGGLLWVVEMYLHARCPDVAFSYHGRPHITPYSVQRYLERRGRQADRMEQQQQLKKKQIQDTATVQTAGRLLEGDAAAGTAGSDQREHGKRDQQESQGRGHQRRDSNDEASGEALFSSPAAVASLRQYLCAPTSAFRCALT